MCERASIPSILAASLPAAGCNAPDKRVLFSSIPCVCIQAESPVGFWVYILAPLWLPLCYSLAAHLVEEVDDDVVLLHAQAVEVLPHHVGQLVLGLSPELFAPCDCRRVEANAPRLREHPFVVVADEGGRCLEAVCSAVGVEDVPLKSRPLKLLGGNRRALAGAWRKRGTKQMQKPEGRPTPGALVSCVLAVGSGAAAAAAAVELALVTSRRLEPALLATLRILDPPPLPFFSLAVGVSAL